MLINCDVRGLEVVVAAELSNDSTLKQEIVDKVDIHDTNRVAFGLGEGKPGRLVAKIFKFRLIYGGSAYSYANDPDFTGVSSKVDFWQNVIDTYYKKYKGIAQWHNQLLDTVKRTGILEIPSGRYYSFAPKRDFRGEQQWPLTTIKNYPVQGFGADLVMLARIEFMKQLRASGLEAKFIQTVHDSLVVDCPEKNVDFIAEMLEKAVAIVPELCYTNWRYRFSLPLTCEILVGKNKKEMNAYQRK
jgi:DNA polymerase-1